MGLNFKELIFNYHPIFMSLGMILCEITSVMFHRILPFPKWITDYEKYSWLAAYISGCICYDWVGNNYPDYNTIMPTSSAYIPLLDWEQSLVLFRIILLVLGTF
jgi:hypothetical protein